MGGVPEVTEICFNKKICVDVDLPKWEPPARVKMETRNYKMYYQTIFNLIKALFGYSYIPREIVRTKNGLHVYLSVPCTPKHHLNVRIVFGDDPNRIWIDMEREKLGFPVNICFKTSEQREARFNVFDGDVI